MKCKRCEELKQDIEVLNDCYEAWRDKAMQLHKGEQAEELKKELQQAKAQLKHNWMRERELKAENKQLLADNIDLIAENQNLFDLLKRARNRLEV